MNIADLQRLSYSPDQMFDFIENIQNGVTIPVETLTIDIVGLGPVIKSTSEKLSTITEQGNVVTTEATEGQVFVAHTMTNDREYFITSGNEEDRLFTTSRK